MGEAIKTALAKMGRRVRVYTPFGQLLPGMAYLVRRLLENTSNQSFLRAGFLERATIEELLMNPINRIRALQKSPGADNGALPAFRNEPLSDFGIAENREAMRT